jgi:hypothetical protein
MNHLTQEQKDAIRISASNAINFEVGDDVGIRALAWDAFRQHTSPENVLALLGELAELTAMRYVDVR